MNDVGSPRESRRLDSTSTGSGLTIRALLLGDSPAMQRLRALIQKVARSALPILIQGPTGAGKELVAHALHAASGRPGRFVAFNVCAIADTMFEDALFGHARGAFTGAANASDGYLLEADRGTLLLDEIGELSTVAQAKLLRALETRTFRPVGAARDRASDFRLIAATNDDIAASASAGRFRSDLLHRLSGMVLHVPSLADRLSDVSELAHHFALQTSPSGGDANHLSDAATAVLVAHDWPGNVRELRMTVARAAMLAAGPTISADDVRLALGGDRAQPARREKAAFADRRLVAVLEDAAWDVSTAAAALGVHRATVYRRLARLDGAGARADASRTLSRDSRKESRDSAQVARDATR